MKNKKEKCFLKKKNSILVLSKFLFVLFAVKFVFFASIVEANSCIPPRPVCPFEAEEGRTIVIFGDKKIVSHESQENAQSESVNADIPSGSYKVSLFSYDGYEGREEESPQPKESWVVVLKNGDNEIVQSSPIDDLEDSVQTVTKTQVVNENLTVDEDINSVFALNVGYPDESSPNSVYPICAAFDLIESEEEPPINNAPVITLLGNNPITINVGDNFVDPGATASDTEDGDLTGSIVVGGAVVDTGTVGTYVITYNVSDSQSKAADEVTRTVITSESSGGGSSSSVSSESSSSSSSDTGGGDGTGGDSEEVVDTNSSSNRVSFGGSRIILLQTSSAASSATSTVALETSSSSSVLQCSYLKDYLKFGENNDFTEVLKLQGFLSAIEHYNVPLTGVFDQTTLDAVSNFQERYKEDILKPWGYDVPTGYVYITTKNKINEIFCGKEMPLSEEQKIEIEKVRNFINEFGNKEGSGGSGSEGIGGDIGSIDGGDAEGGMEEIAESDYLAAGVGFIKSPMAFILDNKLAVILIGIAITLLVYMFSFKGSKGSSI